MWTLRSAELTEHTQIDDYAALRHSIGLLRRSGLRLAIDDAGAGYSSLRHIVQLAPDLIKVDIGLVRSIDQDPARRALVSSLVHFASETGAQLVAEGIEEQAELETLLSLRVTFGQGYLLGRPSPLPSALDQERARASRRLRLSRAAGRIPDRSEPQQVRNESKSTALPTELEACIRAQSEPNRCLAGATLEG